MRTQEREALGWTERLGFGPRLGQSFGGRGDTVGEEIGDWYGRGGHFQGQRGVWVPPDGLGGMELLGRHWSSMEAINQESI